MRPRCEKDAGEAVMEFIVIAVAVMLPVVFLVMAIMSVQSAATASSHAVREAARAFMLAATPDEGMRRARAAAAIALSDQGFDLPDGALRISCRACLEPGSTAAVALDWSVPLPLVPVLDGVVSVPVHASHRVVIDAYR